MKFWFVAIKHACVHSYIDKLKKYLADSAKLIVGLETSKESHLATGGEHIHVGCEISDSAYKKFSDNIHRKDLKLSGQARDGCPRQYGLVKDVRDETKMLSYTVKDKNIISENIDLKELQGYIEESYPKLCKNNRFNSLLEHLEDFVREKELLKIENKQYDYGPRQLEEEVMRWHIDNPNGKAISRPQIRNTISYLLQIKLKNPELAYSYLRI